MRNLEIDLEMKLDLLSNMFSFCPHSLEENSDLTGLFMHYKSQYEKHMKKLKKYFLKVIFNC